MTLRGLSLVALRRRLSPGLPWFKGIYLARRLGEREKAEKIQDWQKTGANYAMNAPMLKAYNKPGEWNHTLIIVNKGHVEHWLNGKKVVEYEMWSDAWKKAKEEGKWKDHPGYGAAKQGYIAFQASHSNVQNTGVCFKNIKIKVLK